MNILLSGRLYVRQRHPNLSASTRYFFVLSTCFSLMRIVHGQLFLPTLGSGHLVEGYWEYEGDWAANLNKVIDDISRGCGLNRSQYVLMNSTDANGIGQSDQIGACEGSSLSVPWSGSEISQFDPNTPDTIVSILSSVRSLVFG